MTLYGYCHNPCTYESAEALISLHQSKAGAWRALRQRVWDLAADGREYHLQYGGQSDAYREPHWSTHRIREYEVYP